MVNRLSELADFLQSDSLPAWLKREIDDNRDELLVALETGQEFILSGPNGQQVTVSPAPAAA